MSGQKFVVDTNAQVIQNATKRTIEADVKDDKATQPAQTTPHSLHSAASSELRQK